MLNISEIKLCVMVLLFVSLIAKHNEMFNNKIPTKFTVSGKMSKYNSLHFVLVC
jgi:hypothetical protein